MTLLCRLGRHRWEGQGIFTFLGRRGWLYMCIRCATTRWEPSP